MKVIFNRQALFCWYLRKNMKLICYSQTKSILHKYLHSLSYVQQHQVNIISGYPLTSIGRKGNEMMGLDEMR
jgi:hypothetical protein